MRLQKPEPWRVYKARKRRAMDRARRICSEAVWVRDRGVCRACGRRVVPPQETDWWFLAGHVHEVAPRSLGGDATDEAGCVLLCPDCHEPNGSHGNRPAMTFLSPERAGGRVQFVFRDGRVRVSAPPGAPWRAINHPGGSDPSTPTPF